MEVRKILHKVRKERSAYYFILPAFLFNIVFLFIPMIQGIKLSLFKANLKSQVWVGLQNYLELFQDPLFWLELKNTFIITGILVPLIIIFSLLTAILISKFNNKLQSLFTAAFYLPVVTSGIVMSMVWLWIFNANFGLLNYVLSLFNIKPIMWLGEANPARLAVVIGVFSWVIGANIIFYLAALSAIPEYIYEAAILEGTNRWQMFYYITFPLVMPMTLFVLVTSTIGAFQIWEAIYLLTGGGPAYSTTTIAYRIYQLGFRYFKFGEASAQATILLIVVFTVSFLQFKYLHKSLEY